VKPGPPREVRLIGGLWRRSKLPVADREGLRPTPDRVRETLFNWLGQDLTGWRCLDAFGGSGALGFEAASRGAALVTIFERDPALVKALRAVKERLGAQAVEIVQGDGLAGLDRCPPAALDLVFLDPPYGSGLLAPALRAAARAVAPGGFVYAEDAVPVDPAPAGLTVHRRARAGRVHYALLREATLRRTAGDGEEAAT